MSDNVNTKDIVVDGRRLRLKRFNVNDITRIAPAPSVAMIAKRGSGKSVAIRAIIHTYRKIPGGIIISRTEKMSPFFSKFFPDLFIFEKYTSETVQSLLNHQERIKEKNFKRQKQGKRLLDTRVWLIMDDCLAHKGSWLKDEPIQEVFMNGRHYDLFFILTMQYPLGIGPDLRSNFDFIFIFGENFVNIQRKIHEHYAGMFPTFEAFRTVFKKCTVNFGCMVINNRIKSDRVEDMVYWWKAPDRELKKLVGHKTFLRYHHTNYEPDYKKKYKSRPDINDMCKKRRNYCELNVDLIE